MKYRLALALALAPAACKKSDAAAPSAAAAPVANAATPPGTVPAAGSASDAAVEAAAPATDVSGAFLADVKCGDFDTATAATNLLSDTQFLGCIFENPADGKRIAALKNYQLALTLDDGSSVVVDPRETGEDVGWHFGFDIPKATHDKVTKIVASAEAPAGRGGGSAKDANYDWANDPEFADFLRRTGEALFHAFHVQPDVKTCVIPPNFRADGIPPRRTYPYPADFLAKPYQIIFASSERQPADVGVAGADAICNAEGQAIDPHRTYKAILSTSTQDARDHVKVHAPVFNTVGRPIAYGEADFWTFHPPEQTTDGLLQPEADIPYGVLPDKPPVHDHFHWPIFSACGVRVSSLYNAIFPEIIAGSEVSAWTGTNIGGTYDATAGACKDWTSHDAGDTGAIGRVYVGDSDLLHKSAEAARECSAKGFVLCLSE